MAAAPQSVNSPDGRTWTVSVEGRKKSMKETREQPFFWAHIVVTAIIGAIMIYIFRNNNGVLWILVVAVFLVWAIGAAGAAMGLMVRADTQGPPKQHLLYKVDKRGNSAAAQQNVANAIKNGDIGIEVPHTRLEEI